MQKITKTAMAAAMAVAMTGTAQASPFSRRNVDS